MVTQKELAQRLGLSQQAVSLCFNRPREIAAATRERVLALAHELGYRPNSAARAMSRGRFNTVALIHDAVGARSNLPVDLLNSIEAALEAANLQLSVAQYDSRMTDPDFVPRVLREVMADGLLVNFQTNAPPQMAKLIEQHQIPSVWLNTKRTFDAVYLDDFDALQRLTAHFLERGHRRIAYVDESFGTATQHYSKVDRHAGYLAAMQAAGLEPDTLLLGSGQTRGELAREFLQWLDRGDRPDVVLTYSGGEVQLFLIAVLPALGLHTPQDLLLGTVGYADDFSPVPVTKLVYPYAECGRALVDMLLERIKRPGRRRRSRTIAYTQWSVGDGAGTANDIHF